MQPSDPPKPRAPDRDETDRVQSAHLISSFGSMTTLASGSSLSYDFQPSPDASASRRPASRWEARESEQSTAAAPGSEAGEGTYGPLAGCSRGRLEERIRKISRLEALLQSISRGQADALLSYWVAMLTGDEEDEGTVWVVGQARARPARARGLAAGDAFRK